MRHTEENSITDTLVGSLLLASPGMLDPNFNKSVILLSVHSHDEGALGVIINRPSGKTLSQLDSQFAFGPLANVPIYQGGPVATEQMILSAWKCCPESGMFKLYFGISAEKASEIREKDTEAVIRAFFGYSGWTGGQLENEINEDAWIISPVNTLALSNSDGDALWRKIINDLNPDLSLLPKPPEDPSVN